MIVVPNFYRTAIWLDPSLNLTFSNLKLIKFETAIMSLGQLSSFSEVRLGWVKARVGYPITTHHYG